MWKHFAQYLAQYLAQCVAQCVVNHLVKKVVKQVVKHLVKILTHERIPCVFSFFAPFFSRFYGRIRSYAFGTVRYRSVPFGGVRSPRPLSKSKAIMKKWRG